MKVEIIDVYVKRMTLRSLAVTSEYQSKYWLVEIEDLIF